MADWSTEIQKLNESGCSWNSGNPEHAKQITELVRLIACDTEIEPHDKEWAVDQIKRQLNGPKTVLRNLLRDTEAKAFPPPPPPEGCIEATEQPPDLQIAQQIFEESNNLIAERAASLFRYEPQEGYWNLWPDTPAKKAAQTMAQRFVAFTNDGWGHPYGSATQVKAAVEQLKVLTSDGPLAADDAPAVIVFRNGTFNLQTSRLEDHDPAHGATYGVAADYIAAASCPMELERVINTCYPLGTQPIVRALIRWTIDPTIRYGEAFHIIGDSGTGKGLLIDFIRSLLPNSAVSSLRHPAELSGPERLQQYVVGRRLVAFPDTPAILNNREGDSCNLLYELIENKPVTTRMLYSGQGEVSRQMNCRFILGSVKPLQLKDGRDGYLRRVITFHTLPRQGDTDDNLREALNLPGERYDAIRAEAISWALDMPLAAVNDILNRNDQEQLLRDAAKEAAVNSNTISQWADQCLTKADEQPNRVVTETDWHDMYTCYAGWCLYVGIDRPYKVHRLNFKMHLRAVLGPRRCIERKRASRADAHLGYEERETMPKVDVGFILRHNIIGRSRP